MLIRIALFIGAIYLAPTVRLWAWDHVPPALQVISWHISEGVWVFLCAFILFVVPWLRNLRGNPWATTPGRWIIGRFAAVCVLAVELVPIWLFVDWQTAALAAPAAIYFLSWSKRRIGKFSSRFRRIKSDMEAGMGGSAKLGGILQDWELHWKED